MNSLYSVIHSFVVTNKSTAGELRGVYTCVVDMNSTKVDIKNAIRALYGAEVAKVNILHTRPKVHFTRKGVQRKRGSVKKAMITLRPGQKIANFDKVQ